MTVPVIRDLTQENPVVPLARYAQLTFHQECQFFGVENGASTPYFCKRYWTKENRDQVTMYLNEAQRLLEESLNFTLSKIWIADEQHPSQASYHTRWGYLIEPGIRAVDDIELCAPVDLQGSFAILDPAIVGPIAYTGLIEEEIKVYYPDTDIEIHPSFIDLDGVWLTIEIPRCRLVTQDAQLLNTENSGIEYTDDGNFLSCVDVKRVYNDPSTQAVMTTLGNCLDAPCAEETETGCILIKNAVTGYVKISPATYSNGAWTRNSCCQEYVKVLLNYHTGVLPRNMNPEQQVMRLAHSLMPESPCGCDWVKQYWDNARSTPTFLHKDRLNNPYGLGDGAWMAWRWVITNRLIRGGLL
jgi:hypothetical protein